QDILKSIEKAKKSKFYTEKLKGYEIKSMKEFKKIPLTTKDELRNAKPYDLLSVDIKEVYEYHESFGTTGQPVTSWYTEKDMTTSGIQINESAINFNEKDIVIMRFPYAISVPAHIFSVAMHQKRATIVPVSKASAITPYPRVINLLKKLDATIIACNPYEALLLSDVCKKMGYDPKNDFKMLRAICVAGEMLTPSNKKRIEEVWGVEVYNFYGSTETANIATSCEYGNLHVSDDYYLEVLDEKTKEEVKEGERGMLCVTQLNNEACPLIRYDIQDIVEIHESNCKCGRKNKIMIHHGRLDDIIKVKDNYCTMYEFQQIILGNKEIPVDSYFRIKV
ncbi:MAG: phenylacetate--CoA ligase family protein, partial [Clostridium sp.]